MARTRTYPNGMKPKATNTKPPKPTANAHPLTRAPPAKETGNDDPRPQLDPHAQRVFVLPTMHGARGDPVSFLLYIQCDWGNEHSTCTQRASASTLNAAELENISESNGWGNSGDKHYCPTHKGTR